MNKLKFAAGILFTILFFRLSFSVANAATRTWDGGGSDNNWSTCANWNGPDICPVAGDTVTFNGTSTKNSIIDSNFGGRIGPILLSAGYTGTVTQAEPLTVSSTFSISSGTYTATNQPLSIGSTFTINTGGTFTASSQDTILHKSITHNGGTFNANGGTIIVDPTGNTFLDISGTTTFNNLTVNSAVHSFILFFDAGTTTTVQGTLTMQGINGEKMLVRSFTTNSQWKIDAQGGRVLAFLDVQDSNNINSSPMITGGNSKNSGNNVNWTFGLSNISFSLDSPTSHITNTNPGYRWKKAIVLNNAAISKYELYIQPKDLVTNTNIGTAFYVDNIIPSVSDNKQYAYYPTYTLHDDGNYLNLTSTNYILTPGKYNFRVVAHDSAGNTHEESTDFFVDAPQTPAPIPTETAISAQVDQANITPTPQISNQIQNEVNPSFATPTPTLQEQLSESATPNTKAVVLLASIPIAVIAFFIMKRLRH